MIVSFQNIGIFNMFSLIVFVILMIIFSVFLYETWMAKKSTLHLLDKIEITFWLILLLLSAFAATNAFMMVFL